MEDTCRKSQLFGETEALHSFQGLPWSIAFPVNGVGIGLHFLQLFATIHVELGQGPQFPPMFPAMNAGQFTDAVPDTIRFFLAEILTKTLCL